MPRDRAWLRRTVALHPATISLLLSAPVAAQMPERWTIDAKSSLAWWQINPHYNHLWATTCPGDPSWQAGEGRSQGYLVNYATRPTTTDAGTKDTRIPLFPRKAVNPVCTEAVHGDIVVRDRTNWGGVQGSISVAAEQLVTGLGFRDLYTRRAVLQTSDYPEIGFRIDSVAILQRGDTIRGAAFGLFQLHGVSRQVAAPFKAWQDAGAMRVQTRWMFPARDLTHVYKLSKIALEMGVVAGRWEEVHMGADLILRPPSRPQSDR